MFTLRKHLDLLEEVPVAECDTEAAADDEQDKGADAGDGQWAEGS